MDDFVKRNAHWVNAISSIGQVAAAIAAAIALWFAYTQIIQTKNAIKATSTYQIQKDGRDLVVAMIAEPDVFYFIFNAREPIVNASLVRQKANIRIGIIFNFYASVHLQYISGTLNDELWGSFLKEFCFFIQRENVRPNWESAAKSGNYRSGFVELAATCKKP